MMNNVRLDALRTITAPPGLQRSVHKLRPVMTADQREPLFDLGRHKKMGSADAEAHAAFLFRVKSKITAVRIEMRHSQVAKELQDSGEHRQRFPSRVSRPMRPLSLSGDSHLG